MTEDPKHYRYQAITKILPLVSRFSRNNDYAAKKQTVLDELVAFFERFFGLI